ncbi:hypothetical protein [Burkholderia gladioli]|nr:hypothetical protein [Burkholderia gladioli]MBU9167671.1 hypothetical protein [Burkholderia gladioli]MBU9380235.1 hypothetical protein [Burkholderia gladioli]
MLIAIFGNDRHNFVSSAYRYDQTVDRIVRRDDGPLTSSISPRGAFTSRAAREAPSRRR